MEGGGRNLRKSDKSSELQADSAAGTGQGFHKGSDPKGESETDIPKFWGSLYVPEIDEMIPRKATQWQVDQYGTTGGRGLDWRDVKDASHAGVIIGGGPIRNPVLFRKILREDMGFGMREIEE